MSQSLIAVAVVFPAVAAVAYLDELVDAVVAGLFHTGAAAHRGARAARRALTRRPVTRRGGGR